VSTDLEEAEESIVTSYSPLPRQREFHEATEPFKCYMGGFGAGKTKCGIWECLDQGLVFPGNRMAIMRDTMPDLRDTTMATFFDECPPELIYTYRRKENVVILTDGTEFLFRSFRQYATSARNQFQSKLKGLNLGGFYIDEMNETTKDEFILMMGRLRLQVPDSKDGRRFRHFGIGTTNPTNEQHWIFELFAGPNADKKNYKLVQASSRENPHLPPDYIPNLERAYPKSWVDMFIDGKFGQMIRGLPMYEGFKAGWHDKRRVLAQPHLPIHRYWDFGWHRPAVIWAQVSSDGHWRLIRESMGYNQHIQSFAPKVLELSNTHFGGYSFVDYGDPAGRQVNDKSSRSTIKILDEDFGIKIQSRNSAVKEGVDIVQKKLITAINGEPGLQVDPEHCPILIAGFVGGYARDEQGDVIKDGYYEHLHDALRYGAVNVFGAGEDAKSRWDFPIASPGFGPRSTMVESGWRN
jgi:hypothetical protein